VDPTGNWKWPWFLRSAAQQLQDDPERFLRANTLYCGIRGDKSTPSGPRDVYLYKDTTGSYGGGYVLTDLKNPQGIKTTGAILSAHVLPQESKEGTGLDLSSVGVGGLIVTPGLSGCTIAADVDQGQWQVRHIKPRSGESMENQQNLKSQGKETFGPQEYDDAAAVVMKKTSETEVKLSYQMQRTTTGRPAKTGEVGSKTMRAPTR
jgi:hypothetical protein